MRKYGRVDENQGRIVSALLQAGASVQSLSPIGCGCPDLLVGHRGKNWLLENKTEKGTLTKDQVKWHLAWKGEVVVVHSPIEAIEHLFGRFQK